MPFNVDNHPTARKSKVASAITQRLKEDVEAYAKEANSHVEPVLNSVTIPSLETLLRNY